MQVDERNCLGCGACHWLCTMGAISFAASVRPDRKLRSEIDQEVCVDCGVCLRSGVCPADALIQPPAGWPRSLRGTFSNPLAEHKETRVPGRGTEEMKTNDVTGRYRPGFVGVGIEMGRPNTGAYLSEVEKLTVPLAAAGVTFEPKNPLSALIGPDGKVNPEALGEKVLSCIIEFVIPRERLAEILACIDEAAPWLGTVCSIDLVELVGPQTSGTLAWLRGLGQRPYPNGKINVGLGKLPPAEGGLG